MRVLLSPLARAPLPTRVFFFFFFVLPSFPPPLPFAIRQSALFFSLLLCYKFQFSSVCRPKRGANGKGASERKQNAVGLLSLSLSRCVSVFRARFFVLARSRFSAASKRVFVVFECVTFFPSRVSSTVFFFSHKFRVFESFQALLDPVSETTFFRPSSEHPLQRARARERPP